MPQRFTKLLLLASITIASLVLSSNISEAQQQGDTCQVTNIFPAFPIDFLNDNTGWIDYDIDNYLSWVDNGDGTVTITGNIINGTPVDFGSGSNGVACGPDDSWYLELTLSDKQDWATWSGSGGTANVDPSCDTTPIREGIDYWDVAGTLTGTGCRTGETITINGPSASQYRFQVGYGGNRGSSDCSQFGLSTWFDTDWDDGTGTQAVKSDIYGFIDESCYSAPPASCSVNVDSATPTACDPADNTYDLDVTVTYANEPPDTLAINAGSGDYYFVPDGSGSETFTLTGLTSNGAQNVSVIATFLNDLACTHTLSAAYNAPELCANVCCINILTNGGFGEGDFIPSTTFSGFDALPTDGLSLPDWTAGIDAGGYWFDVDGNKMIWLVEGADGQTFNNCVGYNIPNYDCWVTGHTYQVCLDLAAYDPGDPNGGTTNLIAETVAPGGILDTLLIQPLSTNGSANNDLGNLNWQTICIDFELVDQSILYLSVLTASNPAPTIGLVFDNVVITDKTDCSICSITVDSATPTACDPADNTYDLDVAVTYSDEPSGDITITVGGADYTFTPDGSGSETFTITGLNSNGTAGIDVTATFVADNACTYTLAAAYDAPAACTSCVNGTDEILTCSGTVAPSSHDLPDASGGSTWSMLYQPSGASATIDGATGLISSLSTAGEYIAVLSGGSCTDTVHIIQPACELPCVCYQATTEGYADFSNLGETTITGSVSDNFTAPIPGHGDMTVSYDLTFGSTRQEPATFSQVNTLAYQALGYTGGTSIQPMYLETSSGNTQTVTFDFDTPIADFDFLVFDIDEFDNLAISATDENGDPIADLSGWIIRGTGDATTSTGSQPAGSIAPPPIFDPIAGTLTSSDNTNQNRSFIALRPDELISSITVDFTSTTGGNHVYLDIYGSLSSASAPCCAETCPPVQCIPVTVTKD